MVSFCILLIDDHALFRSGMSLVLQASIPGVQVLEVASLEQAVSGLTAPPGLVLLDIKLQGVNGLEGIRLLKQRWPHVPIIVLSGDLEPDTARLALSRGAMAFVSKADTAEKIIDVIHKTLGGRMSSPAQKSAQRKPNGEAAKPRLTPRQCEVLDLLCEGLANKVIARRLELSEFTVRGHVQSIFALLQVSSRSQATFAARRIGLVGG